MKGMYSFFNKEFFIKNINNLDNYQVWRVRLLLYLMILAYNSHDLDDGLRANLFSFQDITKLPLIDDHIISYTKNISVKIN